MSAGASSAVMTPEVVAALDIIGPLVADRRVEPHVHVAQGAIEFRPILLNETWSTGERAVLNLAHDVYSGNGIARTFAVVDRSTRRRMLLALTDLVQAVS